MERWGWRIPFWLGGGLGIFSYTIRRHINESAIFLQLSNVSQRQKVPIFELTRNYKRSIFIGILLIIPATSCMSILFFFSQSYLTQLLHYESSDVTSAFTLGITGSIVTSILTGLLADKNRDNHYTIKLMDFACLIIVPSSLVIFYLYTTQQWLYIACLLGGITYGPISVLAAILLSTTFPTNIRYSGVAISYNVSLAIFGGLAPIIAMLLIKITNDSNAPAYYLVICALLGLVGNHFFKTSRVRN